MRVVARPLDGAAEPWGVLRELAQRSRLRGLPPPAALVGDWFGGGAVIAPSVRITPVPAAGVFPASSLGPAAGPDEVGGPVGGGWIGYLGYGPGDPRPGRRLPPAAGGWAEHVLRRDASGQWWFEALQEPDPALVTELSELVGRLGGDLPPRRWRCADLVSPDPDEYRKAVRLAKEEIVAGEIYQVNVCTHIEGCFTGEPAALFAAGVAELRPRRAALLSGAWGAVASLSPELFLARHGRTIRTAPIKGTLPRRGPADAGNAAALLASAKDVAENVMIVDMARNDLSRVCTIGSVTVPRLLEVQPHPGVWHLVSTVTGQLAPDVDDAALLAATFPPASVTGAPKQRALQVIAGLERWPREVYCGAVGMASPVAGTELNVAIRTLEFHRGRVWFGVGGGITADSDADAEWAECGTKAAPLLALLGPDRYSAPNGARRSTRFRTC
ncbi:MAG: aminodeoxychorismate synthase component I [Pseudonocardiaceae bacterium]